MRCLQCHSKMSKNMKVCPVCHERKGYQVKMVETPNGLGNAVVLTEACEDDELQPVSQKMKSKKKRIVLIAGLILLACIGFVFVWNLRLKQNTGVLPVLLNEASDEVIENSLPEVNQEFYSQGMDFLREYVEKDYSSKAKEIGTESFFEFMDTANEALINYTLSAKTTNETTLSETVRDLCLYSLSTAAEEGNIEEIGGGQSEEDIQRIQNRKIESAISLENLQQATTIEQIQTVQATLNS